jgi:hypothetical protein
MIAKCLKLSKTEELIYLRSEVKRLNKLVDQLMHNDYKGKSFYAFFNEITEKPLNFFNDEYYIGLITITFDRKFVHFQKQEEQLDYIQRSVFKAFHGTHDNYKIVFSIEHHKDGVLHSHMLIQHKVNDNMSYTNIVNYRYELALYFTDRVDNKLTVKLDDVTSTKKNTDTGNSGISGALDYILKEKYKTFKN